MANVVDTKFVRQDTVTAITATPQTSSAIPVGANNRLSLLVNFTRVAGTAVLFTFEYSDDASTWYKVTSADVVAGTGTRVAYTDSYTTSVSDKWEVPLGDLRHEFVRYNISATAGSTDSAVIRIYKGYSA